jgi:PAS domain S-box-containing protein
MRNSVIVWANLIIGLIVALASLRVYFDYVDTMNAAFERLENLARIADEQVSGSLKVVDILLQDVTRESRSTSPESKEANLDSYMRARIASLGEIRTLYLTDSTGQVAATTFERLRGYDASRRPYYTEPQRAADRDHLFVTGPLPAALTNDWTLFLSRAKLPIMDFWDGVTVATLTPAYFAHVLDSVAPRRAGLAEIVTRTGSIVSRSPQQDELLGQNISNPTFAAYIASGASSQRLVKETVSEGIRRLMVYHVTNYPDLIVIIGQSEAEVLAIWYRNTVITGVVLFLLVIATIFTLRRFIAHERSLRESRERLRLLFDANSDAIFVRNVGTGKALGCYEEVNATACRLLGYSREELLRLTPADIDLEMRRDSDAFQARLRAEGMVVMESTQIAKDGRHIPVEIHAHLFEMSGQPMVLAVARDISARRQAEQNLRAAEEKSQELFDLNQKIITESPFGILVYDASGQCVMANEASARAIGTTVEIILAQNYHQIPSWRDYGLYDAAIKASTSRQMEHKTAQYISSFGRDVWLNYYFIPAMIGGKPHLLLLLDDVTARQQAEQRLRAEEEKNRELFDLNQTIITESPFGVLVYDGSGQCVMANQASARAIGTTVEVVMTQNYHHIPSWRTCGIYEAALRALAEKRMVHSTSHVTSSFGREIWLEHYFIPVVIGGRPHLLLLIDDVTTRSQAEIAIHAAKDEAEAANRAKSEFLANMSHEIRTPMNAILGLTHLLGRTALGEQQRDFVDKIGSAGRSLLMLLNDILDFSRIEAGRLEIETTNFRLSEVLDGLAAIMSVNAGAKDVEVIIGPTAEVPDALKGDPLRLKQILYNLAGNALKFTEHGEVVVRVAPVCVEAETVTIRFSIRDTGIGIPLDQQGRLFAAFSQADTSTTRRFGGSGLGLAISKRLVDLMGGEIGVSSTPGQGSEFWFTIPFGRGEATAPASLADLDVLIADDHDVARETLKLTARSLGWSPEVVSSGSEALAHTRARIRDQHPYDVLILDWKMPGLDGLATSKAIRHEAAPDNMPIVIMVTAFSREDVVNSPDAVAIDAVLVKPVTASSLFNAVMDARARRVGGSKALAGRLAREEPTQGLPGTRLLIVEDNAVNQTIARHILEAEGAVVTLAADGRQAVDQLAANPTGFDAVLMDVQMPVMDGYQATLAIREELRLVDLPIIALTAGAFQSERERALAIGMNDFIAKPFEVNRMIEAIKRQLARLARREPGQPIAPPAPEPTPEPEPVAASGFPALIPGIDREQALRRLGQDEDLFATLLGMFVDQFSDIVVRLREECEAGRFDEAATRAHTLRGAAGNMAAIGVAEATQALEIALRRRDDAGTLATLLDRLDATLGPLLATLSASRPGTTSP